jgi:hypothetical protein
MAKFEKGKSGNPAGKPKGAVSEKTKFWKDLKEFMVNEGAEKYQQELMKLEGKEFINAFALLLEYFEPKLTRAELKHDLRDVEGLSLTINKTVSKDLNSKKGKE